MDPTEPKRGPDDFWVAPAPSPTDVRAAPRVERPLPPPKAPGRRFPGWLSAAPLVVVLVIAVLAPQGLGAGSRLLDGPRRADTSTAPAPSDADPTTFAFLITDPVRGTPTRFDPCTPIPYVVNTDGPVDVIADVHEALARTAAETGVQFIFEGFTDEVVTHPRPPYQPERYGERWAPVWIGWVDEPNHVSRRHWTNGWAAPVPVSVPRGEDVLVTGAIMLNSAAPPSPSGFGTGRSWGATLLHEAGHLMGLDHVESQGEVMSAFGRRGPAEWGPGDRAGLRRLGVHAGCLDTPTPRQAGFR